jgi:hypothetical protein
VELGLRSVVNAINFGGKPVEPPPLDERGNPAGGPANRRAEMWGNLKKTLEQGRFSLPDRDSLQAALVSCGYKDRSDGKLQLESKQDMRARGMPSPDEADAVALCLSEPDGSGFVSRKNFNRDLRSRYRGRIYKMTDTTEVQQILVHGQFPTKTKEARLCLGCYVIKDDVITMTDLKGEPVVDSEGRTYEQKLDGEHPRIIASRPTKKIRLALIGKDAPPSGFGGSPLKYRKDKSCY